MAARVGSLASHAIGAVGLLPRAMLSAHEAPLAKRSAVAERARASMALYSAGEPYCSASGAVLMERRHGPQAEVANRD